MDRGDIQNYRQLFLSDIPLMDVRAPIEFSKGAFPSAINLPVLNDRERELVGTCYKENGQDAAITLGHSLLTDDIKTQRVKAWGDFAKANPEGYLYCFRGGLRSRSTQQALKDAGINYPLVLGGYKAMRRFLIDELELNASTLPYCVVAGPTGSGKTELIIALDGAVDLEGLANHRGSSFGKLPGGQPSQIDFENRLSIALLGHREAKTSITSVIAPVYVEDEGRLIGRCALPETLKKRMSESPTVILEATIESRVDRGVKDYAENMYERFQVLYDTKEQAFDALEEHLKGSLSRIKRRLGGERYSRLDDMLAEALQQHKRTGCVQAYRELVSELLLEYYDPMYEYQDKQKQRPVLFKGDHNMIIEWSQSEAIYEAYR
ncbi:tRNA 2-selenouridine(34) synthase MnmH [Gammaproteobacteria bacterium 42_54_T18]|nr:tRNA 2-selenouridine(34) synthase MnmH [Gammaproteobacteria bacterium 42_54_T18]